MSDSRPLIDCPNMLCDRGFIAEYVDTDHGEIAIRRRCDTCHGDTWIEEERREPENQSIRERFDEAVEAVRAELRTVTLDLADARKENRRLREAVHKAARKIELGMRTPSPGGGLGDRPVSDDDEGGGVRVGH